jgi:hypothetical protein
MTSMILAETTLAETILSETVRRSRRSSRFFRTTATRPDSRYCATRRCALRCGIPQLALPAAKTGSTQCGAGATETDQPQASRHPPGGRQVRPCSWTSNNVDCFTPFDSERGSWGGAIEWIALKR